jgi:hypothetical protein
MSTIAADLDLAGLIRERLAMDASADPHRVALGIIEDIPEDQCRAALAMLLPDRVRLAIRQERREVARLSEEAWQPGESKWDLAARVFGQRVHVAGEWKRLGECTRDDLAVLAGQHDALAAENAAQAKRYRAVARVVARAKADRVSDVPAEKILEAWHA